MANKMDSVNEGVQENTIKNDSPEAERRRKIDEEVDEFKKSLEICQDMNTLRVVAETLFRSTIRGKTLLEEKLERLEHKRAITSIADEKAERQRKIDEEVGEFKKSLERFEDVNTLRLVAETLLRSAVRGKILLEEKLEREELRRVNTSIEEKACVENGTLNVADKHSDLSEFPHFILAEICRFERMYCLNFPSEENYLEKLNKRVAYPHSISATQITDHAHFRKWLWFLIECDQKQCHTLGHLKGALGWKLDNYLWFARQMEAVYTVFGDDGCGKSPFEIEYVGEDKVSKYVQTISGEVRSAIEIFVNCRAKK